MAIERMIFCPEVKIVLHAEKRPRDAHERIYNEMPGNLEEPAALHFSGRLLQQWSVDQFSKVQLKQLKF
jgi:S-adenosylmethionine:tRNA-ribosyltransferase-isomerase (queuine synthetase)